MKIIVFGTGYVYEKNKHKLVDFDLIAFFDNDSTKYRQVLDGAMIDKPENHYKYEYDAVVIMSVYYNDMRKQLLELGVPEDKIIDKKHRGFFEKCVIKHEYRVRKDNKDAKRILIISNELSNTGAPIVLFNMASILLKLGYLVDIISLKKGPLLYSFIDIGANVTIYDWDEMIDDNVFVKYDLIILNTIVVYQIAKRLADKSIPVLWWLHEDKYYFENFNISSEDIPVGNNIYPLAVSDRVKSAYIEYTGRSNVADFCYGLEEIKLRNEKKGSKIVCAIIGYVGKVKGHDVLLEAIRKNKKHWKDIVEFWIIGSISDKDKRLFESFEFVKVWGNIGHNRLMDLYSEIDIVLCASRHESMSVAVVEGMMFKKLCIVSRETGNAKYCIPYENALLIESGDSESLTKELNWALSNKEKWQDISEKGYKVFQDNYSMNAFEERVLKVVSKYV